MKTSTRLINIIYSKEFCNGVEITLDTDLTILNMDSLDSVELIMEIEKNFEIEIPDDDAELILKKRTIHDICMLLERLYRIPYTKEERKSKINKINISQRN